MGVQRFGILAVAVVDDAVVELCAFRPGQFENPVEDSRLGTGERGARDYGMQKNK